MARYSITRISPKTEEARLKKLSEADRLLDKLLKGTDPDELSMEDWRLISRSGSLTIKELKKYEDYIIREELHQNENLNKPLEALLHKPEMVKATFGDDYFAFKKNSSGPAVNTYKSYGIREVPEHIRNPDYWKDKKKDKKD